MTKKCDNCRFCILEDHGYSNYTVEGTYVYCAKKLHPEDGFDRWFGEDKRLEFAEKCPEFTSGAPVSLDVDGENELDASEREVVAMWDADHSSLKICKP
jgi:hypothetical protein